MLSRFSQHHQPLPSIWLFRLSVVLLVVFAVLTGYYEDRFRIWQTNHLKVLEKFGVQSSKELLQQEWEQK
jgi:hypothetical protein